MERMYYLMMIEINAYDRNETCYRVIGSPPTTTLVGAGFMKKSGRSGIDWPGGVFKHFSVSFVLRGTGTYVRDDGVAIPIEPGCLFFRIPGVPHSNRFDPDSGWLEFFIGFCLETDNPHELGGRGQESLGVLATRLLMLDPLSPVYKVKLDGRVLGLCRAYLDRLKHGRGIDTIVMDGIFLLMELLKNNPPEVQVDPLIDDVCALLRDNVGNRTSLPELCKDFPLSYVRLRERFALRMGKSMGRFQLEHRMEVGSRLLCHGLTVKEVAYRLGYSDPFAFSKQFRQIMGIPPSKFL